MRDTRFLAFWRNLFISCAFHGIRPATLAEAAREYASLTIEQRARHVGAA